MSRHRLPAALAPLAAALMLAACSPSPEAPAAAPATPSAAEPDEFAEHEPMLAESGIAHVVVPEAFTSPATPDDNIDSPAAWSAPDGATWVIATAKEGKGLVVYDGDTGETLQVVGTVGEAPGQFSRPNGIAVHGDRVFVVERDNRRVQVLSLPGFETLATFGQGELRKPYGLWVREHAPDRLEVLVTDAYMLGEDANGEEIVPPVGELDRRVQRYRVDIGPDGVAARHAGQFGDTTEAGAIRIPESLWGDVANDRLLIAEEDIRPATLLREYSLAGQARGRNIGEGLFKAQAEGIALFACPDGSGAWLATDQYKDFSLFHVFDRKTLEHRGAFAGQLTANTDGVWLHQAPTARFPNGVFYAVHDDMAVSAFDWRDIAKALDLPASCN